MKNIFIATLTMIFLVGCAGHSSESHDHHHEHEACHHDHSDAYHHGHAHDKHNAHGAVELSESEAKTAGVEVVQIIKAPFVRTFSVSGKLEFAQTDEFVVTANSSGIISFLRNFTDGTPVKNGTSLCTLESDHLMGGDPIKKIEVTYMIAKEELERKEKLLKDKIVTQNDYNAALERFEKARIEYESVLKTKEKNGNIIKSPISGYVLETLVENGDFVSVGTPIVKLVRNNKMMLTADVPLRYQQYIPMVKSATFVPEGTENVLHTDSLKGKMMPFATGVSSSNAYIALHWELDRKPGLWAGSFAKIYLHTEAIPDAIAIPVSALTDEGGTFYVYVKTDADHYRKTKVTTGTTDGKYIHITAGLHEGESVVVEGVMCVRQAGMSKIIGGHGHSH